MPVADELTPLVPERRIGLGDVLRPGARGHEARLLASARPALPLLMWWGRRAVPLGRIPGLGWVTSDPRTARALLNDRRLTVLGEGGVGHLWAQILGDWVNDLFDGAGHHDLRTRSRDLFTERASDEFVAHAWGDTLVRARAALDAGEDVDVADLSRVLVGRMVVTLLGLSVDPAHGDEVYREVFRTGEELATIALGTTADTHLSPGAVERAREIVARLTAHIDAAFEDGGDPDPGTVIGRCRTLGLSLTETKGLCSLLMVAGTETAASAMARTAALLHDTGEQHRLLARPDLTPDAVREGLRVTSPAPLIGRSVAADLEIAGRMLRRGDRVTVLVWAADNLAGDFRIDRPYSPQHRQLWFGAGRHLCLGAPLARAELTAVVDLLLGDGRPFTVVRRRYARKVLIPTYAELVVRRA